MMQIDHSLNIIMLSCSNEVGTVVEAIRLGAVDYLTKPFEKTELDAAMLKCRQKKQLRAENTALREYCDQLTEDLCFLAALQHCGIELGLLKGLGQEIGRAHV